MQLQVAFVWWIVLLDWLSLVILIPEVLPPDFHFDKLIHFKLQLEQNTLQIEFQCIDFTLKFIPYSRWRCLTVILEAYLLAEGAFI